MGDGGAAPKRGGGLAPPTPPLYVPTLEQVPGNVAGLFAAPPLGCILHGSRSTLRRTVAEEYRGTVNYVRVGASGLGWNVTVGHDVLAVHMSPRSWGHNARGASRLWLAAEFAQPTVQDEITEGQIAAFAWWFATVARPAWPRLPLSFPMHAELPEGKSDGKSDVFPAGSALADVLRARILAELQRYGIRP